MKRLVLFFAVAVMLTMTVGYGYGAEYVPIVADRDNGKKPARTEKKEPAKVICWQTVYDEGRNLLRQQIYPANGGDNSGITQEMLDSLATIRPEITSAGNWDSFGHTCKPMGWRGFVDYSKAYKATPSAPPPGSVGKTTALPAIRQPQAPPAPRTATRKEVTVEEKVTQPPAPAKAEATAVAAKPAPAKRAAKPAPAAKPVACVSPADFDKLKEQVGKHEETLNGKKEGENSLVEKVDHYWTNNFLSYNWDGKRGKLTKGSEDILTAWVNGTNIATKDYVNSAAKGIADNQKPWVMWLAIAGFVLGAASIIWHIIRK